MYMLMCSLRDEAVIKNLVRLQPQVATAASGGGKVMASRIASGQLARELEEIEGPASAELPALAPVPAPAPAPRPPPEPIVFAPPPVQRLPAKGAEARLFAIEHKLRRNDPCPCGSGLKFKKCCYVEEEMPVAADVPESAAALPEAPAFTLPSVFDPPVPVAIEADIVDQNAEFSVPSGDSSSDMDAFEPTLVNTHTQDGNQDTEEEKA
jgi:hypothetical protein